MKLAFAATLSAGLVAIAACTTVNTSSGPASPSPSASSSAKAPAATSPAPAPPASTAPAQQPASPAAPASAPPNVTDPWAVVSAYYGDIESGNFPEAWALLSSGAVTGQTYQQFVSGFACTGSQILTKLSETGDQVTFNLDATDSCTGQVQHFTGTDTVQNGHIVAAHVVQTG